MIRVFVHLSVIVLRLLLIAAPPSARSDPVCEAFTLPYGIFPRKEVRMPTAAGTANHPDAGTYTGRKTINGLDEPPEGIEC